MCGIRVVFVLTPYNLVKPCRSASTPCSHPRMWSHAACASKKKFIYKTNMACPVTISTAGRNFGREAARVAVQELSRISETGESLAGGTVTPVNKVRDVCQQIMGSKVAIVCIVFLITFIMLCAINPPMAQTSNDPNPNRSWKKIMTWSLLAALTTLVIPYGKCLVKPT